jgi:hypothetical protein
MRGILISVLVPLVFMLAGCNSPATKVASPTPSTATPTSSPQPSGTPTQPASTQTASSSVPLPGTPASVSSVDIGIIGSDEFVSQTNRALSLLAVCAPNDLAIADGFLNAIEESDRSGMLVDHGVFLASHITAFAPGYSDDSQVFWYAGSIIHDAHHRSQAEQGMTTNWSAMSLEEREALEWDARAVQVAVLKKCGPTLPADIEWEWAFLLKYLTDMQDGITPCDYCDTEWESRNW